VLRPHHRSQLRHDQVCQRLQVALALHEPGELGQVGLQPVLLLVGPRCIAKVRDHLVDRVLEPQHFASRFNGDAAGQIALNDRCRYLRDSTDLRREVGGELIDVVGEIPPRARRARNLRLSSKSSLDADLPRDRGDLVREGPQRLCHVVDGVCQRADLALGHEHQFLGQVAAGNRGDDLADAAHLVGEVGGHKVDVVRQIFPGARDTRHPRLTAKLTVRADLARDPGHLGREYPELFHHCVDGVLELDDLSARLDGNLLGQVSVCDRGRDQRDVAHLRGQVPSQRVHAVGEILPRAGRAWNARLATKLPLDPDFSSHRGDLVREGPERVRHVIDSVGERRDFPSSLQHQLLSQVAVRNRGYDLGDAADLAGEVGGHHVDVVRKVFPRTRDSWDLGLATKLAVGSDFASDARHLARENAELFDHCVDGVLQLEDLTPGIDGDLLRQIAGGDRRRHRGDITDLVCEVAGEEVDVVREVLPRPRHSRHFGLASELALDTDLARHGGDLLRERPKGVGHRVDGVGEGGDLAFRLQDELLREVAIGDRGHDLHEASDLVGQI